MLPLKAVVGFDLIDSRDPDFSIVLFVVVPFHGSDILNNLNVRVKDVFEFNPTDHKMLIHTN